MRDWAEHEERLNDAGGRLVFVTAEPTDVVRAAIDDKKLAGTWAVVDPSQWAAWGVANDKRPSLPIPGTIVIGPDGRVDRIDSFVDYKQRRPPADTVAQLADPTAAPTSDPETSAPTEVDFARAVGVEADSADDRVILTLDIADGFVVYGAREKQAVPLSIEVASRARPKLPPGDKKTTPTGTQRVLVGTVQIPIRIRDDASIVEGRLTYQACYETLCAPPTTTEWAVQR